MRYFLDCEFDGLGGALLSLALVREDGPSLYLVFEDSEDAKDPWVRENVLPIIGLPIASWGSRERCQARLTRFLHGDPDPVIITEWPDDISYFCGLALTGPGTMIDVPSLKFEMHRVHAYPTDLPGAIQHNAWWDAKALQRRLSDTPTPSNPQAGDA